MSMFKQLKRCYPYLVDYPREPGWWGSGDKWYQLSTWCNEHFGQHCWEYYDETFMFKTEREKLLFLLRWK